MFIVYYHFANSIMFSKAPNYGFEGPSKGLTNIPDCFRDFRSTPA